VSALRRSAARIRASSSRTSNGLAMQSPVPVSRLRACLRIVLYSENQNWHAVDRGSRYLQQVDPSEAGWTRSSNTTT
jgi:hypothetical protein